MAAQSISIAIPDIDIKKITDKFNINERGVFENELTKYANMMLVEYDMRKQREELIKREQSKIKLKAKNV